MSLENDFIQLYIDEELSENLMYSSFYAQAISLDYKALTMDELDLKKFVVVLCPLSSYQEVKERFRYYRHLWFICFDGGVNPESTFYDEKLFIIGPGVEKSLTVLVEKLVELARYIATEEIEKNAYEQDKDLALQAQRYLDLVYNSFKYQFSQGSLGAAQEQVKEISDFFLARRKILEKEDEQEVYDSLYEGFKRWGIVKFEKVNALELVDKAYGERKKIILPAFSYKGEREFYVCSYSGLNDARLSFYIYNLVMSLEKFKIRRKRVQEITTEESMWEQIFQKLEVPMVLLSEQGDVLIHNNEFTKLNILPGDCLEYETGQKIEIQGKVWSLSREEVSVKNSSLWLFVFQTTRQVKSESKGLNSSELGIIAGSIAHELNNPLGGILACVSLLELEDEWDSDDALVNLSDMEKGAQRCKELVEIFLGFSRVSPNSDQDCQLSKSMEQALGLLRFRMIESNLRVDVRYVEQGRLEKKTNSSLMAMVFYLILSEVMTASAHLDLIQTSTSSARALSVVFKESHERIILDFDQPLGDIKTLKDSKLVYHLLDSEGLELEHRDQKIILFRNELF